MSGQVALYKAVHPFPARMAPEIAFEECSLMRAGSVVIDPMVGSGTTIHAAAKAGCVAIGTDVDPLAVLMTRVRTTPIDVDEFSDYASKISRRAQSFSSSLKISSIDNDEETRRFVDYWFADPQQNELRALVILISEVADSNIKAALKIVLSRLIVTKDKGASLGRDVSHSRPHKVRKDNDFCVTRQFELASSRLANVLRDSSVPGTATALLGDARAMSFADSIADMIITSPPYLNAIDYLRGHRLSLVWLGYSVAHIRRIRGDSVGTERGIVATPSSVLSEMRSALGEYKNLTPRYMKIVDRYLLDLVGLYREQSRLLRQEGRAVTVIGNSAVRGSFLRNDAAATVAASFNGLVLEGRYERTLPSDRRYLPPPQHSGGAALQYRMRTETILRFIKS